MSRLEAKYLIFIDITRKIIFAPLPRHLFMIEELFKSRSRLLWRSRSVSPIYFAHGWSQLQFFPAYEIWFKQILYEIDSVRDLFLGKANMDRILDNIAKTLSDATIESEEVTPRRRKREDMCSISEDAVHHHEVDDAHMLEINKRLNRVVMIMKVGLWQLTIVGHPGQKVGTRTLEY